MKTKKSITTRLKRTRAGKSKKIVRRSTSLGHSRANKSQIQLGRRKRIRDLVLPSKTIGKYI